MDTKNRTRKTASSGTKAPAFTPRLSRPDFTAPPCKPLSAGWLTDAVLPDRQSEVCRLLADGLTPKQIAEKLGIAHNSVIQCRIYAARKLGIPLRSLKAWIDANYERPGRELPSKHPLRSCRCAVRSGSGRMLRRFDGPSDAIAYLRQCSHASCVIAPHGIIAQKAEGRVSIWNEAKCCWVPTQIPDGVRLLTDHQRDVCRAIAEGLNSREIGHRLGIKRMSVNSLRKVIAQVLDIETKRLDDWARANREWLETLEGGAA